MDVMALARAEREDLLGLLIRRHPRRVAPSLCAGWSARDVVGNRIGYEDLSARQMAARFRRGLLRVDRVNAAGLRDTATAPPPSSSSGCATT